MEDGNLTKDNPQLDKGNQFSSKLFIIHGNCQFEVTDATQAHENSTPVWIVYVALV